ncbi:MAG TPA: glycoside hydrolase family 3 N-terminal domain-containing protein, partial [Elusimicrobiales bacterium]|nr:glycoside hydrolase family 3 N-terminal domain-containing protein [Elusimicrobiales bacterium]
RLEASQLRALGLDLNFAPVCDVATETYNPGILSRSYDTNPAHCAELVAARIRGLQSGGISATAKHYPGKGHATVDAHLKLPFIDSTLEEMEKTHLLPFFSAINAGVDCIMSSHPLYRNIDSTGPATFSKKLISGLLREKYGFNGVIVSDALEMGAITEVSTVEDAIIKAEEAGHDLLLVCTPGPTQKKACDALFEYYASGKGDISRLKKSVARIQKLLQKRSERFAPAPANDREAQAFAAEIAGKAARVLQSGGLSLPLNPKELQTSEALIIVPRYSDITATVMIDPGMENMEHFVRETLGLRGEKPRFLAFPINPTQEDLAALGKILAGTKYALLLLWDAGLSEGWQKALELVQSQTEHPIAILLRDFYDARFLQTKTCAATAFGFRKYQTSAALNAVFSATGPKSA